MNANARTATTIAAEIEQTGWTEDLFVEVCSSTDSEVFELFEKYYATFKSVVEFGESEVAELDGMRVNTEMYAISCALSSNPSDAVVQFLTQHREFINWHKLAGNESAIELLEELYAGLDKFIYTSIMTNPVIDMMLDGECVLFKYEDNAPLIKRKFLTDLMANKRATHIVKKIIDESDEYKSVANKKRLVREMCKHAHLVEIIESFVN